MIVIRIMGNAMKTTTMRGKCLLIIGWMLWLGSCGSEEPRSRLQRLQAELTALRQQSTMDPEREAAIRLAMARAYVGLQSPLVVTNSRLLLILSILVSLKPKYMSE